jgi:heptosyltransferase-2
MQSQRQQAVFGVFKGMGDLLWASPVVRNELERGVEVHMLVFPNETLTDFCTLVDFGPQVVHLHIHKVPFGPKSLLSFLSEMRDLLPSYIWISPHAPIADSSWRIPFMLWLIKQLFWREAIVVGAASERLSSLFHKRLQLDRTLPLPLREWAAYRQFRADAHLPVLVPYPRFIAAISDVAYRKPIFDLVIHPGAGAQNRIWPPEKYGPLLAALPTHWRVAVVGLPSDLSRIQSALQPPAAGSQIFFSGSLQETLKILAASRMLFVMNSGAMHFAEVLGVPTVALFGQQQPAEVIGEGWITPVYRQCIPCQPCGRATCRQPEVYCLTTLEPLTAAQMLIRLESTLPLSTAPTKSALPKIEGVTP